MLPDIPFDESLVRIPINGYAALEGMLTVPSGARGLVGFAKATSFPLKTRSVVPTLTTLSMTNNRFALRLFGDAGKSYIIQASTNLGSSSWTPVVTNVANGGSFDYTNLITGGFSNRFFRAQFKP